jgi:hypothetical protein
MNRLQPSERLVESDWLVPRLRAFGSGVTGVVPDGFPAYVRILHPARSRSDAPVRWEQIAAWSGRTMHRLAEFHRIIVPLPGYGDGARPWDGQEPRAGDLAQDSLRVLCATLREHTTTSDACWFCVWDGYGWEHGSSASATFYPAGMRPTAPPPEERIRYDFAAAPRASLSYREYLLFEGPLETAIDTDWSPGGRIFPQSPNLFWPQDHAWCVASEIDLYATLVGGPQALADALVANRALEAWHVEPTDPVTSDGDRINM